MHPVSIMDQLLVCRSKSGAPQGRLRLLFSQPGELDARQGTPFLVRNFSAAIAFVAVPLVRVQQAVGVTDIAP